MGNPSRQSLLAPAAGLDRENHQLYALWIWYCPDRCSNENEKALLSQVDLSGTKRKGKLL